MRVVVATHGHCFDGFASAVLFTRLLKELAPESTFEYRACGYGAAQQRPSAQLLSGEQNAILDYRYSHGERLTWFFDHHKTCFAGERERQDFVTRQASGRFFFDATYGSCTKLIRDIARDRFGVSFAELEQLVSWADTVDSANFDDARQATDYSRPVLRFASIVEHHAGDAFLKKWVPLLCKTPIEQVADEPWVAEQFRPLGEKHARFKERVQQSAQHVGRVVFVDLTDHVVESVGKFVTYALYPRSVYSVIIGRLSGGIKISVGYNPWCQVPRDTDLSAVCARFGGGGHPVVGGIAFSLQELDKARGVARQIANELSRKSS